MLPIENDFSRFDRLDWFSKIEVGIRFLVELLAHIYDKTPNQILEIFCLCDQDLPQLRYEDQDSDNASDPQWLLFRYFTALHTKDLLSRTLESSTWKLIQRNSLSCREEIKYKSATYPRVPNEDIIYQSEGDTNGVGEITRIVKSPYFIPLEECWAYRSEVEQYLATNRAFDGWLDLLPTSNAEVVLEDLTRPEQQSKPTDGPQWDFRPVSSKYWAIGPVGAPSTVEHMGGFAVIRSGLQQPWKKLSPHGIDVAPRSYDVADDVPRTETKPTTEEYFHEDLSRFMDNTDGYSYVENTSGMPILDATSLALYKNEIRKIDKNLIKLKSDLASNQDQTSREHLEAEQRRLNELRREIRHEIDEDTRPDGRSRTDNTGDPDIAETQRLRALVRRAKTKLRENKLHEIADHLKAHFSVAERYVFYEPIRESIPRWSLSEPDPAHHKSED